MRKRILITICMICIIGCTSKGTFEYESISEEKYKIFRIDHNITKNQLESELNKYYSLGYIVIEMNNRFVILEKMYYAEEILK